MGCWYTSGTSLIISASGTTSFKNASTRSLVTISRGYNFEGSSRISVRM